MLFILAASVQFHDNLQIEIHVYVLRYAQVDVDQDHEA